MNAVSKATEGFVQQSSLAIAAYEEFGGFVFQIHANLFKFKMLAVSVSKIS
jgi:hypothetical protein